MHVPKHQQKRWIREHRTGKHNVQHRCVVCDGILKKDGTCHLKCAEDREKILERRKAEHEKPVPESRLRPKRRPLSRSRKLRRADACRTSSRAS
jgi:hypothetical protein